MTNLTRDPITDLLDQLAESTERRIEEREALKSVLHALAVVVGSRDGKI